MCLSDYLTICLWTDNLPEILNLRIYRISKYTSEREGLLSLLPDCRVSVKESKERRLLKLNALVARTTTYFLNYGCTSLMFT